MTLSRFTILSWVWIAGAVSNASAATDLTTSVRAEFCSRTNRTSVSVFARSEGGTSFVRNPKCWLAATRGLEAIHAGYGPGATAITPWHVIGANHWKNDAGAKLYFCDLQNRTLSRTVAAGTQIRPDVKSDIWLGVLDEALPASVTPLALMPPDWTNHIWLSRFPVAALNQAQEFGSAEIRSLSQPASGWFAYGYSYSRSSLAPTHQFKSMKGGDSGRPIVTIVDGTLILLGHLTFEFGDDRFAGPDYSLYASDIQEAIRKLGPNASATGQKLHIVDLSKFQ